MPAHAIPGSLAVLDTARAATDGRSAPIPGDNDDVQGYWRDQALCALADPDLWFPEPGESPRTAKLICGWCPVREQCLAWALETSEPYGIYGGLTPAERHVLSVRHATDAEAEPTEQVA